MSALPCSVLLALLLGPDPVAPRLGPLADRWPPMAVLEVPHVHDADTFMAVLIGSEFIRGGRPYRDTTARDVRIRGLDAPERFTPRWGVTTDALRSLLGSGTPWVDPTGGWTFTRIEADVYVVTPEGLVIDVAGAMNRMGHRKGTAD